MTKARDLGDFISDGTIAETVTADGLNLGDNEKIQLGAGSDLQIYHDGSTSFIDDAGTGNLVVKTNGGGILLLSGAENLAKFVSNDAVRLYYDNAEKLATTSTGVDVTGTIAVSGDFNATSGTFTVQSNGTDILNVTSTLMSPQTDGAISIGSASNAFNDLHLDGSATIAGITYPTSDGSSGQFLKTDGSGNLSFATVSTSVSINDLTDATTVGSGVGLGSSANNSITSGIKNIAVGESSSRELTTASETVSVGHASGLLTTTGSYNVNLGAESNYYNVTGDSNVSVGRRSLYGAYGQSHSRNTAVGYQSGFDITTGVENFFGGYLAAKTLTSGNYNVAIGSQALYYPSTGNNNVAIGKEALYGGSGGNPYNNVAIGESSGRNLTGTHNSNTIVGHQAGSTVASSSNTLIGAAAGGNIITGSNNVAIGYNSQASSSSISNEITLGGATHNRLRIPGITSGASDGDVILWNATSGSFETGAAEGGMPIHTANGTSVGVGEAFLITSTSALPSTWSFSSVLSIAQGGGTWIGWIQPSTVNTSFRLAQMYHGNTSSSSATVSRVFFNSSSISQNPNIYDYLPLLTIRIA